MSGTSANEYEPPALGFSERICWGFSCAFSAILGLLSSSSAQDNHLAS